MSAEPLAFSDEQAEAHDRIAESLRGLGVDIDRGTITPMAEGKSDVLAVIGKAGSGKTLLLAELVQGAGKRGG
jgi:exodeoxyribonuclease-5